MIFDANPVILPLVARNDLRLSPEMVALVEETLALCERGDTRLRVLSRVVVVQAIIWMAVFRQNSIAGVLTTIFAVFPWVDQFTDSAFYNARERIGSFPLQLLFERLSKRISYADMWRGFRIRAMDGTSMNLQDTPDVVTAFGKPNYATNGTKRKAGNPQMKIVAIMCPLVKAVLHVIPDRHNGGERQKALHLVKRLAEGDLLLFDSGFSGAPLFQACIGQRVRFVGRIAVSWKPKILEALGLNDWIVRTSREQGRLTLRLIHFRYKDQLLRILTDLVDPIEYPASEIVRLYLRRWEQEMGFGYLKRLAGPAFGNVAVPLRSKSTGMVLQEFYALLIAYNLVCLRGLETAQFQEVPATRVSFTQTLTDLRLALLGFTRLRQSSRVLPERRKRSYPRALRVRRQRYPDRKPDYGPVHWDAENRLVESIAV